MSEETKQLEAGRALDRLVAEKMGYPVRLGEDGRTFGIFVVYSDSKPHFLPIPGFSTEIDMAWRVVEKYNLSLIRIADDEWLCGRYGQEGHDGLYSENDGSCVVAQFYNYRIAPTAAHAICLAFLELELE
jgi:hypothetical protein